MTVPDIIAEAAREGMTLVPDGSVLRVRPRPGNPPTPALREALVTHKPDLLAVLWRLDGMRSHSEPIPTAKSREEAPGGPGVCFSCGDPLDHSEAYGRCVPCGLAVEAYYRMQPQSPEEER